MAYTNYIVSGVNARAGGDNDGNVHRIDVPGVYTDVGADVNFKLVTHEDNFGTNRKKSLTDVAYIRGERLNDLKISVIPDGDKSRTEDLKKPSLIKKILTRLKIGKKVEGTTLAVELSGTASAGKAVISEMEFPSVDVSDNYD